MNVVDDRLTQRANLLSGRERLIAIHGNRFILFSVFAKMDLEAIKYTNIDLGAFTSASEKLANDCLSAIIPQINQLYPDSYPGNIFKNQDRQAELFKTL